MQEYMHFSMYGHRARARGPICVSRQRCKASDRAQHKDREHQEISRGLDLWNDQVGAVPCAPGHHCAIALEPGYKLLFFLLDLLCAGRRLRATSSLSLSLARARARARSALLFLLCTLFVSDSFSVSVSVTLLPSLSDPLSRFLYTGITHTHTYPPTHTYPHFNRYTRAHTHSTP